MKTNKQGLPYRPGLVARLEGQRFGLLTVISRAQNAGGYAMWNCRCTCGAEIIVGGNRLRQGRKNRCASKVHKVQRTMSLTVEYKSEYQSWRNMRGRCTDPSNEKYTIYGGRGIIVCERWNEFKNFMLDMGRKPDPKFTIEREDVNGDYEPKNCHWISRKDQGRNKRNSVFVTYQGRKLLLIDLVEELGLSRQLVYERLKLGWTLAQAIALPLHTVTNTANRRGRKKGSKNKIVAKCKDYAREMQELFEKNLKSLLFPANPAAHGAPLLPHGSPTATPAAPITAGRRWGFCQRGNDERQANSMETDWRLPHRPLVLWLDARRVHGAA